MAVAAGEDAQLRMPGRPFAARAVAGLDLQLSSRLKDRLFGGGRPRHGEHEPGRDEDKAHRHGPPHFGLTRTMELAVTVFISRSPKLLVVSWRRSFANEATSSEGMKMGLATGVRSVTLPALIVTFGLLVQAQGAYQRQRQPGRTGGVYKAQITPHWFHDNTRFWYRNDLRGGG